MDEKRVLAMYDVRGKQEYIYRTNHIKEIVGASCIIRDVYQNYLYEAAMEVRNRKVDLQEQEAVYDYTLEKTEQGKLPEFSLENFENRMNGGQYIGEVIYNGGGNFFVLYKNKETCIEINKLFTKDLLEKTHVLRVQCTYIEDLDYENYKEDKRRLDEKHRIHEAQESVLYPVNTLPIVQTDYLTSRPLAKTYRTTYAEGTEPEKISIESYAKYEKYREEAKGKEEILGEKVLDRIITEKGKESLLAVVYIDGNNMRTQVETCLKDLMTYEDCITALRKFSGEIQKNYVDDRIEKINTRLDEKYAEEPNKKRRTVVLAGDEMTIICNARDALKVVEAYFTEMPKGCSSCAGIAIFHSHAPYADAYRFAEECCEEAKRYMKNEKLVHANFMDFHYCHSGMGNSLEATRKREWQGEEFSRPWLISSDEKLNEKFYYTLEIVEEMARVLRKIGRSNVKSLLSYAKESPSDFKMELERIKAHSEEEPDFSLGGKLNDEQMRKLLYDMILVYDLWFRTKEE